MIDTPMPPLPYLFEPHGAALSRVFWLLRHGGYDRAHRRLLPPRRVRPRGAQADPVSAGTGRRRKVLAHRAAEAADEMHPIYVLKAGDELSPVFESPLGRSIPMRLGRCSRKVRRSAPPPHRADEPVVLQAAGGLRRRHSSFARPNRSRRGCVRPAPPTSTRTTRTSPRVQKAKKFQLGKDARLALRSFFGGNTEDGFGSVIPGICRCCEAATMDPNRSVERPFAELLSKPCVNTVAIVCTLHCVTAAGGCPMATRMPG
jgi:hypothetical protein